MTVYGHWILLRDIPWRMGGGGYRGSILHFVDGSPSRAAGSMYGEDTVENYVTQGRYRFLVPRGSAVYRSRWWVGTRRRRAGYEEGGLAR